MKDVLGLPESFFMLYDTIVCVDHFFQQCKVFTYLKVKREGDGWLREEYERCRRVLQQMAEVLNSRDVPLPPQGPIKLDQ
jgi:anthranilate synthase component 1